MRQSETPRWRYLLRAPFKLQSDRLHSPALVAKKQEKEKKKFCRKDSKISISNTLTLCVSFKVLTHLILTASPWSRYQYCLHFQDREMSYSYRSMFEFKLRHSRDHAPFHYPNSFRWPIILPRSHSIFPETRLQWFPLSRSLTLGGLLASSIFSGTF